MPAINFHAQFADAVKSGEKRQTIRARGKRNPPRVGDPLFLYAGIGESKLATSTCTAVELITIDAERGEVTMPRAFGGHQAWTRLEAEEVEQLARDDGFADAAAFFEWFRTNYGKTMSGYLIRWN
jgi:hypothetical protein